MTYVWLKADDVKRSAKDYIVNYDSITTNKGAFDAILECLFFGFRFPKLLVLFNNTQLRE